MYGARLTLEVTGRKEAVDSVAKAGWGSSSFLRADASFLLDRAQQPPHHAQQPVPPPPWNIPPSAQQGFALPRPPLLQAPLAGEQSPSRPGSARDANETVDPSNLTAARHAAEASPLPAPPESTAATVMAVHYSVSDHLC
jgi:hypothetical protein